MSSLGINVGHTGGSMMAEFMIAAKGLTSAENISTGGTFRGGSYRGGSTSNRYGMNPASLFVRRTGWSRQPPVFSKRYEFCYRAVRQSHQQKSL